LAALFALKPPPLADLDDTRVASPLTDATPRAG
jgi:hypothetical protein